VAVAWKECANYGEPQTGNRQKSKGGDKQMALNPLVKKNWEENQKKHDVPVNAIGMKIDPKDANTLKVWREEGLDQFMKK
jgi:hypothetical protein